MYRSRFAMNIGLITLFGGKQSMRLRCFARMTVLVAILVAGLPLGSSQAFGESAGNCGRLVTTGKGTITVEVLASAYTIQPVVVNGQKYHRMNIAGMSMSAVPGAPQTPTCGVLLGLESAENVTVNILEADYEVLKEVRLAPAPGYVVTVPRMDEITTEMLEEVYSPDPAYYHADTFYPSGIAEINELGYIRQQAVAQVQFNPVLYNPIRNEIRLYHRILARIEATPRSKMIEQVRRLESPFYEGIQHASLLNGSSLPVSTANPPEHPQIQNSIESAATNGPALKIGVDRDGLYQLVYSDFTNAGFSLTGVDPRRLKLMNRNVEVPLLIEGEADGQFNPGDRLLFYGLANNDIYTVRNVYWLSVGSGNALRMQTRSAPPAGGSLADKFPVHLHLEQDTYYWQTMPNGGGRDHWFWGDRISPNTSGFPTYRDYPISLNNLPPNAPDANIKVRLVGYTNDIFKIGDHVTQLRMNNNLVAQKVWDGLNEIELTSSFPHTSLLNGQNILRVQSVFTVTVDQIFINWIELEYWDTYAAENNMLLFGAPGAGIYRFEVTGFSTNDIRLFDVSNPANPTIISGAQISASSPYSIEFQESATTATRYLSITPGRLMTPASLDLDQPSSWRSNSNSADYIIVTHKNLISSTLPLATHRSATGLRVVMVDVEDLYDEFNFGVYNPQAIRTFLEYAYQNWVAPAPAYVLLVGGASYDYRDLLNLPRSNLIPTQMIETFLLGETASDNWFVAVSGNDILPDMMIGRLPAENVGQADDMISKIIEYDTNPRGNPLQQSLLLIADGGSSANDFEAINNRIASGVTPTHTIHKVYHRLVSNPKPDILNYFNQGPLFANYAGHGTPTQWSNFFYASDVASINNPGELTIVTVGNCLSGFFVTRTPPSLAEAFIREAGNGAVAVWAPTGTGYPSGHQALLNAFYGLVYSGRTRDLGTATTQAKINVFSQSGFWGELVETFVLIGDPATRVVVPTKNFLPVVLK